VKSEYIQRNRDNDSKKAAIKTKRTILAASGRPC
jgi:hypothetical protein